MFTRSFWRDALERASKTAGQSALLAIGADQLNALTADWLTIAGFALGGAALSIATSLASYGRTGTPSAIDQDLV